MRLVGSLLLAGALVGAGCSSDPGIGQIEIAVPASGADSTGDTAVVDEIGGGSDQGAASTTSFRLPTAFPDGSGCTPITDDELPAGRWFGYLRSISRSTLEFDLACSYSGSQAELAADEDGALLVGEVYVRNAEVDVRILETNPGIAIGRLDPAGGEDDFSDNFFYPEWRLVTAIPDAGLPVWISKDPPRVRAITLLE